jgi:sirohydrochlorin cobaltochelatase
LKPWESGRVVEGRFSDKAPVREHGLLIVGHGTRDPQGVAEFLNVVERVESALDEAAVEPAFLEMASPTIEAGVAALVDRGARRITVLPLLLFAAGHAKRDIPQATEEAAARHAGLQIRQADCLGCHPAIVKLSLARFMEAVSPLDRFTPEDTLLVMIGRGSHDAEANAEMFKFARLRFEVQACGWLEVGFTAMARPPIDAALQVAARLPHRRIVVQPHLLFHGELVTRVRQKVAEASARFPEKKWICTDCLGPDDLLVAAALDRAAGGKGDISPLAGEPSLPVARIQFEG